MFIRGSRYRSLPESSPLDAAGERLRGKDLRVIPPPLDWPFRHTVHANDRLDLLSFKYYGEPTKWWQIADANPQEAFPMDLLDRGPMVKERFVLRSSNFETRFRSLVLAVALFRAPGTSVITPQITSFGDAEPAEPSFIQTGLILTYPTAPTTHQEIVNTIESGGFKFLGSFAWSDPPNTVEEFTFIDQTTRDGWRRMVASLTTLGVIALQSVIFEGILDLVYNNALTARQSIVSAIESQGFALKTETTTFPAIASKIVIPPNQVV